MHLIMRSARCPQSNPVQDGINRRPLDATRTAHQRVTLLDSRTRLDEGQARE